MWWNLHRKCRGRRPMSENKRSQNSAYISLVSACIIVACSLPTPTEAVDCPVNIGELKVLEHPVNVRKVANRKLTTLQIREEQYLGSLTCHVLRDTSQPLFDHFSAHSDGQDSAGTYDLYSFGKKRQRFYNCDIYLKDTDFQELAVDLDVVLILQPLLGRNGRNECDVPLVSKQRLRIEFEGYVRTTTVTTTTSTTTTTTKKRFSFPGKRPTVGFALQQPVRTTTRRSTTTSRKPSTQSTGTTKRQPKVVPQFPTTKHSNVANGIIKPQNLGGSNSNNLGGGQVSNNNIGTNSGSQVSHNKLNVDSQGTANNQPALTSNNNKNISVQLAGTGVHAGPNDAGESTSTLFWGILAIILVLALALVAALIYYCCPGFCAGCCTGDGHLFGKDLPPPLGTAKDLTFVSVLDSRGRPLRAASTVEVWNTQKNNIKTYPVVKTKEQLEERKNSYVRFTNENGHLQQQQHEFVLAEDGQQFDTGDHATLVGHEDDSPVMVRVLRAMTPRTFSARLARSRWKNKNNIEELHATNYSSDSDASKPRIFEIVRDEYQRRRSGKDRKDVQILTLDEHKQRETFRRVGNAEILEIGDGDNDYNDEDLIDEELSRPNSDSMDGIQNESRRTLDVVNEEDEANLSNPNTAKTITIGVGNDDEEDDEYLVDHELEEIERKLSDNKEQQTDFTYGRINKRIQTIQNDVDQSSDIDLLDNQDDFDDVSSGVLSQSMRSTHSYGGGDQSRFYRYKDRGQGLNEDGVGFLNVAMHHLVQDELQAKHRRRPHSGPVEKIRSKSQLQYHDSDETGSEGGKELRKKRSDGSINYYNGARTHHHPPDTKASILRKRKKPKPEDLQGNAMSKSRKSTLHGRHSSSMSDLNDLVSHSRNDRDVPYSKHNSFSQRKPVQRQNSEPLGIAV